MLSLSAAWSRRLRLLLVRAQWAAGAIALVALGLWAMDQLTNPAEPDPAPGEAKPTDRHHAGPGRMLLLLVDSLRYETATDPARMPYLASMTARGTHGRVESSRDAVTVSAIREMFTGRSRFLIYGFIRDFAKGRENAESFFTQLGAAGVTVAVHPRDAFVQFGGDIPAHPDPVAGMGYEAQDRRAREVLRSYLAGEVDVAVIHLDYTDQVAHAHGIYAPAYRHAFARVDALIREMDLTIPAEETFAVTGDHGHDEAGRHSLGLDIPSFTVYRGPGFRAGYDLGQIPIAEHRYLMSWALHLPLSEGYRSARHPDALLGEGPRPPAFAQAVALRERSTTARVQERPRWMWWLVVLDLGLLAGLWLGAMRGHWALGGAVGVGFLVVVALVAGMAWHPLSLAAALVVGLALVGACVGRAQDRLQAALHASLGVLGAVGFHQWGQFLALERERVHEPLWQPITRTAFALIVLGGVAAWRLGGRRAGWVVLGLVMLFGYPTVYRYGAVTGMVTVWLAWVAVVLVDTRPRGSSGSIRRIWPRALGLATGILLLVQPYAFADAGNFEHIGWATWVKELAPDGHTEWLVVTVLAKAIVFVRWRVPRWLTAVGVAAVYGLMKLHHGTWPTTPGMDVLGVGVLAVAGALAPRWLDAESGRELRRLCWLSALFWAQYYLLRVPGLRFVWLDMLLAALVLSARLARLCAPQRALPHHHAMLSLLAVLVAGWVCFRWTLHDLEWGFLYDWLPAATVEHNALWLMPFIGLRYLAPVLAARLLLRELLGETFSARIVATALGLKLAAATLLVTGIGMIMPDTNVYLEAVQELAILLVLGLALV